MDVGRRILRRHRIPLAGGNVRASTIRTGPHWLLGRTVEAPAGICDARLAIIARGCDQAGARLRRAHHRRRQSSVTTGDRGQRRRSGRGVLQGRRLRRRREFALSDFPEIKMTEDQWSEVDRYFSDSLLPRDPILDDALEATAAAGLPAIAVSPNQGKLLQILAQIIGARSILEIGTLGGYSTIWMARGLKSGGKVVTLEIDEKHADVARSNFVRAGLKDVIDLVVGNALETLPRLAAERRVPFDFIFIDADKQSIPTYFEWALKLSRQGTVIVVDNVVREGD